MQKTIAFPLYLLISGPLLGHETHHGECEEVKGELSEVTSFQLLCGSGNWAQVSNTLPA